VTSSETPSGLTDTATCFCLSFFDFPLPVIIPPLLYARLSPLHSCQTSNNEYT
jgi:hypothetical protein